jgi:hypothetical protein
MSASRRIRITALLTVGALVAALVAPAAALGDGGNRLPWALDLPADFVWPNVTSAGDTVDLGEYGSLEIPAGALFASTDVSCTVGILTTPQKAQDGGTVYEALSLEPDGLDFSIPVTLSLALKPAARGAQMHSGFGIAFPRMYGYDAGSGTWTALTHKGDYDMNDIVITYQTSHFSIYGIGGDELHDEPVPASSTWSLALGALGALGVALVVRRRKFAASR